MNKEEFKEKVFTERMVILQAMAESYLIRKKDKYFSDEYPNVTDKYGIINLEQEQLLREFLKEYFNNQGRNLEEEIKKAGEDLSASTNKLTKYEIDELTKIADYEIIFLSTIIKRKERLLKKES